MLDRLKQTVKWQNFTKYKDKFDENGEFIGSLPEHSETLTARVNVSAAKGTAEQEMFGALLEYDRTIAVKHDIPMDENSIVWLDGKEPPEPHNYIVVRKSKSGNYTVFALKRVEVGADDDDA